MEFSMDVGKYHRNKIEYEKSIREMYEKYGEVTLSEEYGHFVQENLLRFTIRLSRYKFVARIIKQDDDVLEIGCGTGLGSIFISQFANSVTGLDVQKFELNKARELSKRKNLSFEECDFFIYNKEKKYDVIVSLDVIEHFDQNLGNEFVKKISCHLKKGGMAIIGTPSIYSFKYESLISQQSHIHCYDQSELCLLMDKYFARTIPFSMNDEIVHTGHPKMAWYYFIIATYPETE